ncbi:MAG: acyl-CoA/acyl-ACP dehydrogenase [Acidimicrobiales bacterium]|jgi:alkylation response protein AidB-like acyl-CoA dehydrogenase|nr:acyl-CoA/acyl-ACP dehydrogenase [Acidimicrobiales bacterium]
MDDVALRDRLDRALPVLVTEADRVDADAVFPRASIDALTEEGLLGLLLPEDVGGLGATPAQFVTTMSSVAHACGSTSMVLLMHLVSSAVIDATADGGREDLRRELAEGSALATLAFSEAGSRSHFWAPVSQLQPTDGGWLLEARKSWVTSAREADVWVSSVRPADVGGPMESELYLVRRTQPGVSVDGRFDGLGLRGNDSAPANLSATVTEADRLGPAASGFGQMMQIVLPWFALGNSAVSVGLARAALDRAVAHVSGSRFDHLDTAIADLPTVRAYVAKAWTSLRAHETLLADTARRVAEPDEGTVLAVLATKAGCNEMALSVTETALRVAGGAAFSKQVGIDRPYRDARAGFVMAPTSDALFDFAGRALCGMDLF